MVMNGITNASQLRRNLPVILLYLESCLQRRWKGDPWQLDSTRRTKYSVQFEMSRSSEVIKVDLLPTFKANIEGTDAGMYVTTRVAVIIFVIT